VIEDEINYNPAIKSWLIIGQRLWAKTNTKQKQSQVPDNTIIKLWW
jgi:hypothetical protein